MRIAKSKMERVQAEFCFNPQLLTDLATKTAIITGGAGGIGGATARLFNSHGANVILADLELARSAAETLISSFLLPSKARFIPADVTDWEQMKHLFKQSIALFGNVDIVVANAGIMESQPVLDMNNIEDDGDPRAPLEAFKVIDVNLKGTLNSESLLNTQNDT